MLLRRSALEAIAEDGEFLDESFFAYQEDVDLSWRLRKTGWTILYVPSAIALHVRGFGGRRGSPRQRSTVSAEARYHSFKNRYLLLMKHATTRQVIRSLPWLVGHEVGRLGYALVFERSLLPGYVEAARLRPRAMRRRRLLKDQVRELSDRD